MRPQKNAASGWVSTRFSPGLSGRRARGTRPELELRKALWAIGARYRVQRRVLPGVTADLVFGPARILVFVDGCFWHGCPQHGVRTFAGPNARRWTAKLRRNRRRDERVTAAVRTEGWHVIRFWECDVLNDAVRCARRVVRAAAARRKAQESHGAAWGRRAAR